MNIFGLILGLLLPILACSIPINDESQASGTHLFLDNNGTFIDEEIKMDKESDVMVINVSPHHSHIESTTIYDMKSMWMMQVLPKLKECLYMRKPSLLNDVKLDDVQNIETSSKANPINVGLLNTIKSEMIGPKLNRSILPGKFQLYCPQDFDVRLSHLHEIGKKYFETRDDFFDNAAPTLIENHTRRKRQTRRFRCEMFGNSDECIYVIEAMCGGRGISLTNILYHCQSVPRPTRCNYILVPCAAASRNSVAVDPDNMNYCLIHRHGSNVEHCTVCSNDPACRGANAHSTIPYCHE